MRFKITFNRTGRQCMLPMDYQYYLSAWIYKVLANADPGFSGFLHSEGYRDGNKSFKLFCYSPLDFGKPVLWKEKSLFEIREQELFLHVSFHLTETAEKFIIGLFSNQQVYLGDQFRGISLVVKQVERLPEPVLSETMGYKAYSPVVISHKEPDLHAYAQYMAPIIDNYDNFLVENLIHKYRSIPNAKPLPETFLFDFQLCGIPKSKLITVKPYTPQQSKVRGFVYGFTLKCPIELHRLILGAGIGEKNSMGFGWVEAMNDRRIE